MISSIAWKRLTALFLILNFLIRLAIHSAAVDPVSYTPSGAAETAVAIKGLLSFSERKITSFPGRVKKVMEYLGRCDCSPGGGLNEIHQDYMRNIIGNTTYITRWTLERRIPPLNIARASPILQTP